MQIVNPATEEVIADLETDDLSSIAAKYARARAAQHAWAATPYDERAASIRRFRVAVIKELRTLALTQTLETGKPITQSRAELAALIGRLDFFLANTPKALTPEVVYQEGDGETSLLEERISYEPLGVIANISAWNYPWFVGSSIFVPALLTGNTVLYKPSEHASLTGVAIERILHQSGIPEDVFISVIGAGDVGESLLRQPVDGVFFTGSNRTGRRVTEQVASRLVKLGLELGGKDPTYVCEDADPEKAAASLAEGAMNNAGQSCCAVERIYAHRNIFDAFCGHLRRNIEQLSVGDPQDKATYIGPLTRCEQLSVLESQVADAVAKGARLVVGGKRLVRRGYYFEPTLLIVTTDDMLVMRDESFGPIIGVACVDSDEEAMRRMNDSQYGLTAGVYTPDKARAERILAALNAGTVYWNCCDRISPRLPWTGRRQSGLGSTLSTLGIRSFIQPKAWHFRPE